MRDELLRNYENELSYLRQMGAQFAEKYPKIASRLRLEASKETGDPHVERCRGIRVSDGFTSGWMTTFPKSEALLSIVYPHFVRPIPSMTSPTSR